MIELIMGLSLGVGTCFIIRRLVNTYHDRRHIKNLRGEVK